MTSHAEAASIAGVALEPKSNPWQILSNRERQIVIAAGNGLADKQIAQKLGIGLGSVKTYWERIREKANVRSRAELMALVVRSDWSEAVDEAEASQRLLGSIIDKSEFGLALVDEETGHVLHQNAAFSQACEILRVHLQAGNRTLLNSAAFDKECVERFLFLEKTLEPPVVGPPTQRFRISSARFSTESKKVLLIQLSNVTMFERISFARGTGQRLLSHLALHATSGLFVTSRSGTIMFASEEAQRLFHRSTSELVGRKFNHLLRADGIQEWFAAAVQGKRVEEKIVTIETTKRGSEKVVATIENHLRNPSIRALTVAMRRISDESGAPQRPLPRLQ